MFIGVRSGTIHNPLLHFTLWGLNKQPTKKSLRGINAMFPRLILNKKSCSATPVSECKINSLLDAEIYQFLGTLKECLATLEFNLYLATNYIFWSRNITSTPA